MRIILIATLILWCSSAFAKDPSGCNDDDVKNEILSRHFLNPKKNTLQALASNRGYNEKLSALDNGWQGKIENVRQESFDVGSNSRSCSADLTTVGGPSADMNIIFLVMGGALCTDATVVYRIQVTEDGGKTYVMSRCSVPSNARVVNGYVEPEKED